MRHLGRTGLQVAPLCFGGNVLGWTVNEEQSFAVLDAYVEGGGNFIDTADVYSAWIPGNTGGESETILGRWLRARGNRDQIVVATKVGSAMGRDANARGLSRRHILAGVEASLRRLQTDYIDLYQAHSDDPTTPLDETLGAFDDLVRQGKVRYIGASNYNAWRLTRALWVSDTRGYASYVSLQPFYNLVGREEFERDLEALCQELGLGVIPYSSLASGFLSGKYRPDRPAPSTARAAGVRRRYMNEQGFAALRTVDQVAQERGATAAQVALAWLLARPSVTAPIVSATSAEQMRELVGAVTLRLEPHDLARLDAASAWTSDE